MDMKEANCGRKHEGWSKWIVGVNQIAISLWLI